MEKQPTAEKKMKDHKEFTSGWLIFLFVIPVHLLIIYLYVNNLGDRPLGTAGFIAINSVIILICLLFYGLTTMVTHELITVSFGIGLIRKRIALKRVRTVEIVKSPWYYGWGIRIIPNGMLYNISGSGGVELTFHDTRRIIRIGSKDPGSLKREIEKRLS
jgi:hypothetical protein